MATTLAMDSVDTATDVIAPIVRNATLVLVIKCLDLLRIKTPGSRLGKHHHSPADGTPWTFLQILFDSMSSRITAVRGRERESTTYPKLKIILMNGISHRPIFLIYRSASENPSHLWSPRGPGMIDRVYRIDILSKQRVSVQKGQAALHIAAEGGHAALVDALADNQAYINVRSQQGLTPLHLAARAGHDSVVRRLTARSGVLLDSLSLKKQTPLHLAAEYGRLDVCTTLIEMKANASIRDSNGQIPLLLAAENDHPDVVQLFLRQRPDLMSHANNKGYTCAHLAAQKGRLGVIKELRKFNKQVLAEAKTKSNWTALHMACASGHVAVARELLDAGASPREETDEGYTPVQLAVRYGHGALLEVLHLAVWWRMPSRRTGMTALHVAAKFGRAEVARELLAQVPATILTEKVSDLFEQDHGLSALHFAAESGHEEVVRLLLNSPGVDLKAASKVKGTLPLHLASRGGHIGVAGMLLSRDTGLLHLEDMHGRRPLHLAASSGHRALCGLLIAQGAIVDAADQNGWTALHYCAKNGYLDVVQLLVDSGANPKALTKENQPVLGFAASAGHFDILRYLFRQDHDSELLLADRTVANILSLQFLVDLMACGQTNDNIPVVEFALVSRAPIEMAVRMARRYDLLSLREKERARDLEEMAELCDQIAIDLLSIVAANNNVAVILRAHDNRKIQFLDILIELQRKQVVAQPAVQSYLADQWMGSLDWSIWKLILLFILFIFFPILWIICSLPLGHKYCQVPIIKFMSHLVSHIFFIVLLCFEIVFPLNPLDEATFTLIPNYIEWLLVAWFLGMVVSEFTNENDRAGLGFIKIVIIALTMIAIIAHIVALCYSEVRKQLIVLYIRNQLLGIGLLLSFLEFLNFLTFHHLFGPWAVIIRDLMKDLLRFLAILLIFLMGFSLHLCAIYQPAFCPHDNKTLASSGRRHQTLLQTFEMLFFALFNLVEPDYLPNLYLSPSFARFIMKFVFGIYLMITVVVLINLLIAMMSNTYQRIEAQSDTEWKFGRAKLIRNMNKMSPTPAPINLVVLIPKFIFDKVRQFKNKRVERESTGAELVPSKTVERVHSYQQSKVEGM
ncbi:hypothetical protein LAZ67_9000785 [Cordylochernes scorpioides]|uniref:Ion transport domain-containing protein n=1 Tax=Cordylochernes scorpioides TaxID=51811 RepID=A0ABY6KW01_9ARAC|nr:hypothetical protein LAZ67_9000785 [Cordylochernes scorpioides]